MNYTATEIRLLEAILFLENTPMPLRLLAKHAALEEEKTRDILDALKRRYSEMKECGIELIQIAEGFKLSPKRDLWDILYERYGRKQEEKFSKALMETLSIIAYNQPITRSEIDSIRGVSSDALTRRLLKMGFIKETGRRDVPGKPLLFGTSRRFLEAFQLSSIRDLPQLREEDKRRFEVDENEEESDD